MPLRLALACTLALTGAAALAGSAGATTTPACDAACDRFDREVGERFDATALQAAQALDEACVGSPRAQAHALSRQAIVHFYRKDFDRAAELQEKAVRLDPGDAVGYLTLCGIDTEAERYDEGMHACQQGLTLARKADDGSAKKHDIVLKLGFNLALAKVRASEVYACDDASIRDAFQAFSDAHPENGWPVQMLAAWQWDCAKDFDKGFALYKKSCALGHQPSCEQVKYTESCRCSGKVGGR